jgi:hypothetical protein
VAGVRVRLTRKLAEMIDGIDLSECRVGDVLDLPYRDAILLVEEGWALPEKAVYAGRSPVVEAADRARRSRKRQN